MPGTPPAVRAMAIVQVSVLRGGQHDHRTLPAAADEAHRRAGRLGGRRGGGGDADRAAEARAGAAGGDRGGLSGRAASRCRTGARRPTASPSASRRRRPSSPRAPTMARWRRTPTARTRLPVCTCPPCSRRCPTGASARPWVMTSGDQFRPGAAAQPDQRHVEAGLQRDQGARRQDQHPADAGADRHRAVLGSDAAGRLLAGGALGGGRARSRPERQRAPARAGGDGHGRRADRRVRRQVHVQLLAAGHGHPQRRGRRPRPGLDAVHRHADAPRVSVRPLHRVRRRSAPCSPPRSAPAPRPS